MPELGTTAIELELDCSFECRQFAEPLLLQLLNGYDRCSVLHLRGSLADWEATHRTARRRAARATRFGFAFGSFQRDRYADDVHAINTSLDRRQGRPMTAGYRERPSSAPDPEWTCSRHGVHAYGVFSPDALRYPLVAYCYVYRAGELALVSQILGHGDYLGDDVMYFLMRGVVGRELEFGGELVYNRHDSGTDGLRYFKERLGFEERAVEWGP